jgi:hypothetical protein
MDEQVRAELSELLATSGRSVCSTPRTLGMLMRQRCPCAEGPVRELELALELGCVRPFLMREGPVNQTALAEELAARSGMGAERARWAIASWSQALNDGAVREEQPSDRDWSSWNRIDVSGAAAGGSGSYQRAVWHLGLVGLAGAVGGAGLGFALLAGGDQMMIEPWREALEGLAPWLQVVALLSLGVLGGLAGGLLGWVVGGGQSWTYDAIGGTTLGRLAWSALGAFHGAGIGVMCCLGHFGLYGVMPGALLGAGLGSFLGLLAAERMSRFWMWDSDYDSD